ncbi:hypothetical protein FRC07_001603 [Ceratobasidium sp. 392]|nr:hypothetical protein FRC07_001603 [Ceratobasidium sp. 392]
MSHPLTWPSWAKFYPMGINPAVSLTQDLSPEQPVDILLLGCGDPWNILYTLSTDVTAPPTNHALSSGSKKARHYLLRSRARRTRAKIILFTLLEDGVSSGAVWDIFYHFKLSEHTSGVLANHVRKLTELSESPETWNASKYGSFIKLVDRESLSELHRYWVLYSEFPKLPSHRLDRLKKQQTTISDELLERLQSSVNGGASRSATIFWRDAVDIHGKAFKIYRSTFPQGFHFAPAFAPVEMDLVGSNVTSAIAKAKQQFKASCLALQASRKAGTLTLRFLVGDAMALCKALDRFGKSGEPRTEVFAAPWRAAPIDLTEHSAPSSKAPTAFDVIDTSLLVGILGALNILLATQPLLKKRPASQAVMYMDIALPVDWAADNFIDRITSDIPTLGLLIGLVPRPAVSLFTSHSDIHEITMDRADMYMERIAWVDPTGGNKHIRDSPNPATCIHASDLAQVIFSIYREMFFMELIPPAEIPRLSPEVLRMHSAPHYDRSVIAMLWAHARSRLQIGNGSWECSIASFMGLVRKDRENWSAPTYNVDLRLSFRLQGLPVPEPRAESRDKVPRTCVFEG